MDVASEERGVDLVLMGAGPAVGSLDLIGHAVGHQPDEDRVALGSQPPVPGGGRLYPEGKHLGKANPLGPAETIAIDQQPYPPYPRREGTCIHPEVTQS